MEDKFSYIYCILFLGGNMEIFKELANRDYEQLIFMHDKETGLKAVTCIHNSTLGPCLGGLRYWTYEKEEDAIRDVLRLSRGMTYKNAASGIFFGGAKTVILKDPNRPKTEEMFRAFGRFVEGLNGRYITAEDVGTTEQDMDYIYQETDYVAGTSLKPGTAGNPSPSTAKGVFYGLKAAAKEAFGSDSLSGKTILLEGCGNVGMDVGKMCKEDGARIIATDIFEGPLNRAKEAGFEVVDRDTLFDQKADIYCPCALGATVNDESLKKMKDNGIKVIGGSANNQLEDMDKHGKMVEELKIIYAPDYIINSGGVIHCADEFNGGFNMERAQKQVQNIYNQIEKVFAIAKRDNIPTYQAADRMAEERIQSMLKTRRIYVRNPKSALQR